tara:strand:- start:18099 stop:20402 length:2304 start_codon:yes stop_codon:yes gene_type:complete
MSKKVENDFFSESKEYSFSEIYYTILKHRSKLFVITSLIFLVSIYYTMVLKPVYRATSTIMVSQDQKSMSMLDMSLGNERNYIENEIQILKSQTTSYLAIKKLLSSPFRDSLYIFNTRKYSPTKYRKILTLNLLDRFDEIQDLDKMIINDNFINYYASILSKSISISNRRNTDAITISIESFSYDEAKLLVDTLVDVYMQRDLEWITGEMSHLKNFLIKQLERKERELNEIENELKKFQESEKVFGLNQETQLIFENLTLFESEYNNMLAQINIIEERESFLNKELKDDELTFSNDVTNTVNDRLISMKEELSSYESDKISTVTQYGKTHSAVKVLDDKIMSIKDNIEDETRKMISRGISVADPILYRQSLMDSLIIIKSRKVMLESKADAYQKLVNEYEQKLSDLPEKFLEYTRLERIRTIHDETYSFMRKKLEESRIGEASKLGKIRVIDKAIGSSKPIKPIKAYNIILGLCFGLFFSIGFIFVIEYFDNTIKSIEQLERRGLSVLCVIPAIGQDSRNSKNKNKYILRNNSTKIERRLLTHEDPKSPISESYRSLRTSLSYTKNEDKCRVILVSSTGPGEGKTTTIANLAITYANLGKRTLLVDSDLRKPVIHNIFSIDKSPGFTSYLSDNEKNIKKIINKSNINNLDIITSGVIPPNPSELLSSKLMDNFINEMKKNYDVILFDSPPLIAVTDAYVLLKHTSQFLLVVRAGVTEKGGLDRVMSALHHSGEKVLGAVMNAIKEEHAYGAGYYYNYYQYYYGDDKN